MYGLAIDTSNNFSLALVREDKLIDSFNMDRSFFIEKRLNISDIILKYIADLLKKNNLTINDIKFLALINGAGYFTGIRIAIVIAKIIKLSLNIPVFTFSCSYIMFKEIEPNIKNNNFVVSAVDIGKAGCVLAVFNKNNQIIQDVYLDEDLLENFFKTNTFLKSLEIADCFFVGNKQNIFKEIDYFATAKYNDIKLPSMQVLVQEALLLFNKGTIDCEIEALYAKEVDMIVKNG